MADVEPGSCIACGASLGGVSFHGNCPNCGTPAAMSLRAAVAAQEAAAGILPPPAPAELVVDYDHACVGCGRSVKGLPTEGFCPHCGTPVPRSLQHEPVRVVIDDRPCLICGYNLNGMPFDGVCPECGTPVERSLRGALFKYSAPEYLATMHRGVFITEITTGVKALATVPLFMARVMAGNLAVQAAADAAALLIDAAMLLGWWMFTTQDPALAGVGHDVDRSRRPRQRVRIMLGVWAGYVVLLTAFLHVPRFRTQVVAAAGGTSNSGMGPLLWMWAPGALEMLVALITVAFLSGYLRALAPRVPDPTLAKRAKTYGWLIPLLLGGGVAGVCCIFNLAPLAGVILLLVMLDPWRAALKNIRVQQARDAALEATAPPPPQP